GRGAGYDDGPHPEFVQPLPAHGRPVAGAGAGGRRRRDELWLPGGRWPLYLRGGDGMKCDCPSPALCRRLGRHVRGYLWQLWNTRADYRALWEREAAARTPPPWWRRAWNFLRALVPHAGRGFPRASWWVRTRRRD